MDASYDRRSKRAAAVTRKDLVPHSNLLDWLLRSVSHRHKGGRDEALIRVADGADIPVLACQLSEQRVLRVVRVLVLVDEDVAKRLLPALERLGEAPQHVDGEEEHVVEVDRVRPE